MLFTRSKQSSPVSFNWTALETSTFTQAWSPFIYTWWLTLTVIRSPGVRSLLIGLLLLEFLLDLPHTLHGFVPLVLVARVGVLLGLVLVVVHLAELALTILALFIRPLGRSALVR